MQRFYIETRFVKIEYYIKILLKKRLFNWFGLNIKHGIKQN